MLRRTFLSALGGSLAATATGTAAAATTADPPTTIVLPPSVTTDGIAIGRTPFAYAGSQADGSLYRINLHTKATTLLYPGAVRQSARGMAVDTRRHRLFVAGDYRPSRVFDARTGELLATHPLPTPWAPIVDVALTDDYAWFLNSTEQELTRVSISDPQATPTRLLISGDLTYVHGIINGSGITTTPDGTGLIMIQAGLGKLFRVSPEGESTLVDLGGQQVLNGDGLYQLGNALYVAQEAAVTKIELNAEGTAGQIVSQTALPRFSVSSALATYGGRLYVMCSRPAGILVMPIP